MIRVTALLVRLVLALSLGSCAPSPTPCTTPGVCSAGEECLANRCVRLGSDPVARDTRRLVLRPHTVAVVSASGPKHTGDVPNAVTFGSAREGAAALYLAYEIDAREARSVDSAFLLLEPLPMSTLEPGRVEVEAWRVAERWDRDAITWLAQPAVAPPHAHGVAQSSPPSVLRIDVSAIVRFWLEQPRQNRGLALKARGGDGHGVSFATGAGDGTAPRLDLYVR